MVGIFSFGSYHDCSPCCQAKERTKTTLHKYLFHILSFFGELGAGGAVQDVAPLRAPVFPHHFFSEQQGGGHDARGPLTCRRARRGAWLLNLMQRGHFSTPFNPISASGACWRRCKLKEAKTENHIKIRCKHFLFFFLFIDGKINEFTHYSH